MSREHRRAAWQRQYREPQLKLISLSFLPEDVGDGDIDYGEPTTTDVLLIVGEWERCDAVPPGQSPLSWAIVQRLQNEGTTEPSASQFCANVWYASADGSTIIDYGTGESEEVSAHLSKACNARLQRQVWEGLRLGR